MRKVIGLVVGPAPVTKSIATALVTFVPLIRDGGAQGVAAIIDAQARSVLL